MQIGKGNRRLLVFLTVVSFFIWSGCTNTVTKTTVKGAFQIKLSSQGSTLKLGRNEVALKVTDSKGIGIEGAMIEVTPWMPEHGHGTTWPPTVTEQGKGLYRAVIPLLMAGHWELRIKVRKGDAEDSALFDFPYVAS